MTDGQMTDLQDALVEAATIFLLEAECPTEQDWHGVFSALVRRDENALMAVLDSYGLDGVT